MRRLAVSVLVLAALGGAGLAHAQKGLSTGPNIDAMDNVRRIEENKMRQVEIPRKAGLDALQAQNFVEAEKRFAELLSHDPTTTDANYLMGIAKIGLNKWPEAKISLEAAVKAEPQRPEPKARLGVAYVMTGDIDAAKGQRTLLSIMAANCTSGCKDSQRIADNMAMLDKVLNAVAKQKAAAAASAPAPATASTPAQAPAPAPAPAPSN